MKTGWPFTALGKHLRERFGSAEHQRPLLVVHHYAKTTVWQLANLIAARRCKFFRGRGYLNCQPKCTPCREIRQRCDITFKAEHTAIRQSPQTGAMLDNL